MGNLINKIYDKIITKAILYHYKNPVEKSNIKALASNLKVISMKPKHRDLLKYFSLKYLGSDKSHYLQNNNYKGFFVYCKKNLKIVYVCWISSDSEHFEDRFSYSYDLSKRNVLLFDAYCIPNYRKYGIHKFMLQYRINYSVKSNAKLINVLVAHKKLFSSYKQNFTEFRISKILYRFRIPFINLSFYYQLNK